MENQDVLDYFAGQALKGLLANGCNERIAETAYCYAGSMMLERAKIIKKHKKTIKTY